MLPPATPRWIKIEQPLYVSKNSQHNRVQQNPVDFTVAGDPGIRLTDALNPHFSGLDGRDEPMFQYPSAGSSVSCRLNACHFHRVLWTRLLNSSISQFPGHPPRSSQVGEIILLHLRLVPQSLIVTKDHHSRSQEGSQS